ncbi:MAG: hypothetical protein IPJ00_12175 [Saprospirales bacterium]|nr:hypothetical protein [Saprospirales bacterium]
MRETGADGGDHRFKGYMIQQFLNPGINRRKDQYGGSVDNRFRFLEEVVVATRKKIGPDYPLGIRLLPPTIITCRSTSACRSGFLCGTGISATRSRKIFTTPKTENR